MNIPTPYSLTVSQFELDSFQFPSAMLDSKSLHTSLLKFMISYPNKLELIRNLSDLIFQIIFSTWWASINVGSIILLFDIIKDAVLHGDSICIMKWRKLAFQTSYVWFLIKFLGIDQTMLPAEWGNTCL